MSLAAQEGLGVQQPMIRRAALAGTTSEAAGGPAPYCLFPGPAGLRMRVGSDSEAPL